MASRFLTPFSSGRAMANRGDPFLELHREMNRLFDDTFRGMGGNQGQGVSAGPRMDVHDTDDAIEISAELPGVAQKDIDISLEGDTLVLRGEKRNERQDRQAHFVERSYGSFQRSLQLPFTPDPDKVQAQCHDGVLTITIPKEGQQQKRRRIEVRGTSGGQSAGSEQQRVGVQAGATADQQGGSAFSWSGQNREGDQQREEDRQGERQQQAQRDQQSGKGNPGQDVTSGGGV